jgi:hypothetical protein
MADTKLLSSTLVNFGLCVLVAVAVTAVFVWLAVSGARRVGFCLPRPHNEYEAFRQAVLRKLRWNFYSLFHCNAYRHQGVARFAWAIPNAAAVRVIVRSVPLTLTVTSSSTSGRNHPSTTVNNNNPPIAATARGLIVDLGAGSGFWAHLLEREVASLQLPIDVVAIEKSLDLYARREDGSIGVVGGPAAARSDLWFDVREGDVAALVALQAQRRVDTLLLVWPPCWQDMAFDAVRAFRGRTVVYVGEPRGGCTVCRGTAV